MPYASQRPHRCYPTHLHCEPTAYELAFVCVFAIYRTADSRADCRVRLGGTLRVRRTRHSTPQSAAFLPVCDRQKAYFWADTHTGRTDSPVPR